MPGVVRWCVRPTASAFALAIALILFGCGSAPNETPVVEEPEYQGLSREEIEMQAEPMSPEVAESLGIVDTTITIQPPGDPDSLLLPPQ